VRCLISASHACMCLAMWGSSSELLAIATIRVLESGLYLVRYFLSYLHGFGDGRGFCGCALLRTSGHT
jgi:hypothetical protein